MELQSEKQFIEQKSDMTIMSSAKSNKTPAVLVVNEDKQVLVPTERI